MTLLDFEYPPQLTIALWRSADQFFGRLPTRFCKSSNRVLESNLA
jgi:hypothetical protein